MRMPGRSGMFSTQSPCSLRAGSIFMADSFMWASLIRQVYCVHHGSRFKGVDLTSLRVVSFRPQMAQRLLWRRPQTQRAAGFDLDQRCGAALCLYFGLALMKALHQRLQRLRRLPKHMGWTLLKQGRTTNRRRTTMKLATIALASAFALSSTFALAHSTHHKHKSGAKTYSTARNYGSYGRYYGGSGQYYGGSGQYYGGSGQYYGNPNNRGGLVGGDDPGTYKP